MKQVKFGRAVRILRHLSVLFALSLLLIDSSKNWNLQLVTGLVNELNTEICGACRCLNMEVCCSFKSLVGGICGFDTRDRKKETQIIPLLACSREISNHTASLGFSGPKDEVDLILSRAALFTQPANIHSMTICPLHREKLGLGWRRGSYARCRVPEVLSNHDKKGKKWPKCDRGIGKNDSQIILRKTGVFLQVGSGKLTFAIPCLFHSNSLRFLANIDLKHLISIRYLPNMSEDPEGASSRLE